MVEKQTDSGFSALIGSLTQLASPFVQQFAYGKDRNSDAAINSERQAYGSLNGSAANDPRSSIIQSPGGIFDFLFGAQSKPNTPAQGATKFAPWIVGIGIVLLVVFFWRK